MLERSTNAAKHSSDPAIAETQGRGEADIAIIDANNLGLTRGTVLYYDMERYDETERHASLSALAVKAFLKGWTDRLKEKGYISGVYGSPTNAVNDWTQIPAGQPDGRGLARAL
ncbi:MAG: glycoside hydrolase domain-containing protein [Pyrinomonadaceae bacterium]